MRIRPGNPAAGQQPEPRPGLGGCVLPVFLAICACALLYAGLLWSGVAAAVGIQLRYDVIILPLALGAVFLGLAHAPGALILPGLMLLSVGLCAAVLSGVWGSAVSDLSLQAGFFQHSDSLSYLDGSLRLFHGTELSATVSRRPLSSTIGAALLCLCEGNVRAMLALTVFLVALALSLPVREIVRTHGWTAGYAMHLALFFFYRRFIGTDLSEHAGLALGCLAFALLWRRTGPGRPVFAPAGIFILALALSARAGAFFVLPALALWAGRAGRGVSKFSATACLVGCVAAAAGLGLNSIVLHTAGTKGASLGNFSYTLYGLVHGGDWTRVLRDRPELRLLPEVERNEAIYDLALRHIAEQPSSLVAGMLRAYQRMFFSTEGQYSFVDFALQRSILRYPAPAGSTGDGILRRIAVDPWKSLHIATTRGWFLGFSVLVVVGLLSLIRVRGPESELCLWAGAGILASVPFAPPWDADLMRVYAATIPLMLVFPAVGASSLVARAGVSWAAGRRDARPPSDGNGLLSLVFIAVPVLCLAPLFLVQRPAPTPTPIDPGADRTGWTVQLVPGSLVRLATGSKFGTWGGRVDPADALRNQGVLAITYPGRAAELSAALDAGGTLAMGYDRRARMLRYLRLDNDQADQLAAGWTEVVAEPVRSNEEILWWKLRTASPDNVPAGRP